MVKMRSVIRSLNLCAVTIALLADAPALAQSSNLLKNTTDCEEKSGSNDLSKAPKRKARWWFIALQRWISSSRCLMSFTKGTRLLARSTNRLGAVGGRRHEMFCRKVRAHAHADRIEGTLSQTPRRSISRGETRDCRAELQRVHEALQRNLRDRQVILTRRKTR